MGCERSLALVVSYFDATVGDGWDGMLMCFWICFVSCNFRGGVGCQLSFALVSYFDAASLILLWRTGEVGCERSPALVSYFDATVGHGWDGMLMFFWICFVSCNVVGGVGCQLSLALPLYLDATCRIGWGGVLRFTRACFVSDATCGIGWRGGMFAIFRRSSPTENLHKAVCAHRVWYSMSGWSVAGAPGLARSQVPSFHSRSGTRRVK